MYKKIVSEEEETGKVWEGNWKDTKNRLTVKGRSMIVTTWFNNFSRDYFEVFIWWSSNFWLYRLFCKSFLIFSCLLHPYKKWTSSALKRMASDLPWVRTFWHLVPPLRNMEKPQRTSQLLFAQCAFNPSKFVIVKQERWQQAKKQHINNCVYWWDKIHPPEQK